MKSVINLGCSNIIKVVRSKRINWAGHVARIWEVMNAYRILVEPGRTRTFGRLRCRWEGNIKM
jgi:hypothetical protein